MLDSLDAVLRFAASMTWNGCHPVVELVTTTYQTGVKLTKAAMEVVETQIVRLAALGKRFVDIRYTPSVSRDT